MKKTFKATSLVEVLVVLGIISSTIIGSMSLVASALVTVRDNQTEDFVNGLLVNTMEIAKSPANLFVNDDLALRAGTTTPSFYRLVFATNRSYLEFTNDTQITDCPEDSRYLIQTDVISSAQANRNEDSLIVIPRVCMQVKVQPRLTNTYEVTIYSVYVVQEETFNSSITSLRYEPFEKI